MSGQNQTWKMGPISASQRLNGQWPGHIQSWGLGDRSIENQLTRTRPGVTMAIDRNKSCVCRYFIDDVFEMIHCLTHSIHLFLNLNLNSEWGVELEPDNHFSARHVIGPGPLFPHSHWFSLTASDQTEWHDIMGTGLLTISVLTLSERRGTLSWILAGRMGTWWGSQGAPGNNISGFLLPASPHPTLFPDIISDQGIVPAPGDTMWGHRQMSPPPGRSWPGDSVLPECP